jgi:ubiquinone/menaquinone biosynthesis C-methylase UbiE
MFHSSNYLGLDCDNKRIEYAKILHPDYSFNIMLENRIPVDDHSVDYILINSVLHHIPSESLEDYTKEFYRVIKENGKLIIIEPCFFEGSYFNNHFMSFFDRGSYIRNEHEYLTIFNNDFQTDVFKKYKQLLFYNKIFFKATPK